MFWRWLWLLVILLLPVGAMAADSRTLVLTALQEGGLILIGLFYGILLTASLYLFFIWNVMRDRSQIFLLLLLVSVSLHLLFSTVPLSVWWPGIDETVTEFLRNSTLLLFYLFATLFSLFYLEIEDYSRPTANLLQGTAGMAGLLLLYGAYDVFVVSFFLPLLGVMATSICLFAGTVALRQQVPGTPTHLLAFAILLLGSLTQPLLDAGWLRDNIISNNLLYITAAASSLLFAMVIAGQFAKRQEEKERLLAISNERFQLAAIGANEGLYDWTIASGEVYFSDRLKKILGINLEHSREGLRQWSAAIYGEDRRRIRQIIRQFLRSDALSFGIEYRIIRRDRSRRWVYTTAVAVRQPGTQKILRLVGSTGDITEKKHSEVALKASEARFRGIAEAHPVPVVIARLADSQLLYASPGAESVLGLPQSELLSQTLDHFFANPQERQSFIEELVAARQVDLRELSLLRPDGSLLPVALSARVIDYERRPAAVIGIYDLSERKRAEEQIAKQREQLMQSEKMAALGSLLAGVAHELNNPLSVVVGQAVLMMEGSKDPKIVARAEKIHKAAERSARIVKSFLAIARRKTPERKPVNLNHVVEATVELLGYQLRTDDIDLNLSLDTGLPTVMADPDQMNQVLTNLIINAKQALQVRPDGRQISVTTGVESVRQQVFVKVSDNGPGVPANIRSRIFEPFFTTKAAGAGTGVGLSLCLNIVEAHGGRISLHDNEGGGAIFVVRLPLSQAAVEQEQAEAAELLPPAPPSRILVVDDEVELAQTLADILLPDGHFVDIAEHGKHALDRLAANHYDLIISDLRMPVLDGMGLYAALTGPLAAMRLRIIFVTGDTLSPNVSAFLSTNPAPVLEKPYAPPEVKRAVARLLHKAGKTD